MSPESSDPPQSALPASSPPEAKIATAPNATTTPSTSSGSKSINEGNRFQIFLGGSCNPTTWRQNVAIPYLQMNGITYYNPQVDNWTPEVVKTERHAKQNAKVLLFVIDKQTRSTVSLVESAFIAGDNKKLVLVIYPFDYDVLSITDTTTKQTSNIVETRSELTKTVKTTKKLNTMSSSYLQSSSSSSSNSTLVTRHSSGIIRMNDEVISLSEFQELRRARFILQNLVAKQRIPMFSDIHQALKFVSGFLSDNNSEQRQQHFIANSPTTNYLSFANRIDHQQCITNMTHIQQNLPGGADKDALRDVYLTLDDDDNNIRSTVISILQDSGLTFNCTPVKNFTDICTTATTPVLPKISLDSQMSITNREESSRYSGTLDPTGEQSARFALEKEIGTIKSSRVLLFVITNKCRGLSIMVLASHFMALFRNNVVLCIQYLEEPCSINGETLTKSAIADYNRGRVYLCDYAIKSQVPVFSTIGEAIECCSRKCGYSGSNNGNNNNEN